MIYSHPSSLARVCAQLHMPHHGKSHYKVLNSEKTTRLRHPVYSYFMPSPVISLAWSIIGMFIRIITDHIEIKRVRNTAHQGSGVPTLIGTENNPKHCTTPSYFIWFRWLRISWSDFISSTDRTFSSLDTTTRQSDLLHFHQRQQCCGAGPILTGSVSEKLNSTQI